MARFSRLEVLNTIVETRLVPLFHHADVTVAKKIAEAVAGRKLTYCPGCGSASEIAQAEELGWKSSRSFPATQDDE